MRRLIRSIPGDLSKTIGKINELDQYLMGRLQQKNMKLIGKAITAHPAHLDIFRNITC
jgi:hypothetical protein